MNTHIRHISILIALCALLFGVNAGSYSFWGRHGEARRAEVSREMVVSGDWAVPHLNGEPFVTKPPLFYWAVAATFTLTGRFDELSARLPSILAGTLGVVVVYLWAALIFSARIGLLAGIILATNVLYGSMARSAEVDAMLTLFISATLCSFSAAYLWQDRDTPRGWNRSTWMFLLAALFLAAANLSKNPIGLAVPLLAVSGFILIRREWALLLKMKPWWQVLIVLLVMLPWFLVVMQRVPNFFDVLFQETLGRYTSPDETPHKAPFYFYLPTLSAFAPWVLFLPGAMASLWKKRRAHAIAPMHLLLIISAAATFLLFSSVGSKRAYYLLPMYPCLAMLTAKFWGDEIERQSGVSRRWREIPLLLFAGLACIAGIGLPITAFAILPLNPISSLIFGVLLLGSGIWAFFLMKQQNRAWQFGVFSLMTVLIYLAVILTVVPEINRYRSRKEFFQQAAALAGNHQVIDYKYEGYGIQFYMQRTITVVTDAEQLRQLIARPEPVFILMEIQPYEALQKEHPDLVAAFEIMLDQSWTSATDSKRVRRMLFLKA